MKISQTLFSALWLIAIPLSAQATLRFSYEAAVPQGLAPDLSSRKIHALYGKVSSLGANGPGFGLDTNSAPSATHLRAEIMLRALSAGKQTAWQATIISGTIQQEPLDSALRQWGVAFAECRLTGQSFEVSREGTATEFDASGPCAEYLQALVRDLAPMIRRDAVGAKPSTTTDTIEAPRSGVIPGDPSQHSTLALRRTASFGADSITNTFTSRAFTTNAISLGTRLWLDRKVERLVFSSDGFGETHSITTEQTALTCDPGRPASLVSHQGRTLVSRLR